MTTRLDDELAQAASLADDTPSTMVVERDDAERARVHARVAHRPRSKNLGLLAGLLAMVLGVVAMFLFGFKEAAIYATPVDQLLASQAKFAGRKVRVEGELVSGTLVKRDQPCEYRFTLHGPNSELPVRYAQCVIPDTFRDMPGGGVQVTIEGTLAQDASFDATLVMAKCTSKYDPKTHEMKKGAKTGYGDSLGTTPIN
jgi:cytochrome c-type biogenesis protein CcmE